METSSHVTQTSKEQRRHGAASPRATQLVTQHTIKVDRFWAEDSNFPFFPFVPGGQVTGRGCSTTDRICVGENTVQSRHLDGFMSSLGCKTKERIGHLYRGRDCENNVVEDSFERKCYCRYHWCNHPDYYYGGGSALKTWQSSWIVFFLSLIMQHCFT